jgi:hypothetical protein
MDDLVPKGFGSGGKPDFDKMKLPRVAVRFSPAAILAVELSRRGLRPGTEEFITALNELVAITKIVHEVLSEES